MIATKLTAMLVAWAIRMQLDTVLFDVLPLLSPESSQEGIVENLKSQPFGLARYLLTLYPPHPVMLREVSETHDLPLGTD